MRHRPILALLCCLAAFPTAAAASGTQESMFQDDNLLVYGDDPVAVGRTMDEMRALGADRLRISVFWKLVAPAGESQSRPAGFDAANPAAYPPGAWDRYDRIVRLARERGLLVNFNVTSPAPSWATGSLEGRPDLDKDFDPNAGEFGGFVRALGTRYSGTYVPPGTTAGPLPRVGYWTIWNEPNQPGWLTPQWLSDPRGGGKLVETAPRIYRDLADAMWSALGATGHGGDKVLIGETAPKGQERAKGPTRALKPGRFIRQLYCLDDNLQLLQGTSAELRGCPVSNQVARMVADHPVLFAASGYAHHPYELTFAPTVEPSADSFTTANLDDLSSLLRRVYQRFGRKPAAGGRDVPLYLTEYGYQTSPPDPVGVSFAKQAAYLNQTEWLTFRNPRVKALTQFLLVDDAPTPGVADDVQAYGGTFQSGLRTREGKPKPAQLAYQLPIFVPSRTVAKGRRLRVFGLVRPASSAAAPRVRVQLRKSTGGYRTVKTVRATKRRGYVDTTLVVRSKGVVRLAWTSGGRTLTSRQVSFRVR